MKKRLGLFAVFLLILSLTACTGRELVHLPAADDYDIVAGATPSGKLRVGLLPGLYSDMFVSVMEPALEKMGYAIEIIHYDNPELPNIALTRNQIDLNMFQHYKSLNNYKFDNDAALSAIVEIPTAPMSIFSYQYHSMQDVEYGAKVSIPYTGINLSRALVVLESAGLISLTPLKSKEKVTIDDIVSNPLDIELFPLREEDLVQSLNFCQLAVIDGGFAVDNNLDLSQALYREATNEDYLVVIAVRAKDLHAQFVNDVISIVNSEEYKAAIVAPEGAFADFQLPGVFFE